MDVSHSHMTADQNTKLLVLSIYQTLGMHSAAHARQGNKGRLLQNPAGRKARRGRMKKEHIYIHISKMATASYSLFSPNMWEK